MTISQYLSDNGLLAKDFAKIVRISAAQLSRIMSGRSSPSWRTAKRISEATNGQVSVSSLMEAAELKHASSSTGTDAPSPRKSDEATQ